MQSPLSGRHLCNKTGFNQNKGSYFQAEKFCTVEIPDKYFMAA